MMNEPPEGHVNPKTIASSEKWRRFSDIPPAVLCELGVAMYEGSCKYGPFSWRSTGVPASEYIDATLGHLLAWQMGEDVDPDSGISHLTKAMASLAVLRDAQAHNALKDDRPPPTDMSLLRESLRGALVRMSEKTFRAKSQT